MEDYQERVIEEKKELDEKLGKLGVFLSSPKYKEIEVYEADRLYRQGIAMQDYSNILNARIINFN